MKFNYTNFNGTWTSITLSDALIETWLMTQPKSVRDGAIGDVVRALRLVVEESQSIPGRATLVSKVEFRLLSDIKRHMADLEASSFQLERENDG